MIFPARWLVAAVATGDARACVQADGQNAHAALSIADMGYVMETGHTILTDTGENLLDNEQVKRAYLGK